MGVDIIAHRNIRENFLRIKQPGEPNIVFADRGAVYLGGVEVQMFHFGRGHTNGDTVIYFPDLKTIHMGDLVIDGMPVIDYNGGGSAVEFVTTIDRMLTLDFDTAIPGHGKLMTKPDVQAYRVRFETMNQRMRELAKQGAEGSAEDARPGPHAAPAGGSGLGELGQHDGVDQQLQPVLRRDGCCAIAGNDSSSTLLDESMSAGGLRRSSPTAVDDVVTTRRRARARRRCTGRRSPTRSTCRSRRTARPPAVPVPLIVEARASSARPNDSSTHSRARSDRPVARRRDSR